MSDPFFPVKEEVLADLADLQELYNRWVTLSSSASDSHRKEYEWITQELKNGISSIEVDLQELEQVLMVAGSDRSRFSITAEELRNRQVSDYSQSRERADLIGEPQPFDQSMFEATIRADNAAFVQGTSMQQQTMIQKQDVELETLSRTVGTLGEMGIAIGEEVNTHHHLLSDLETDVDSTQSLVTKAQKKLKKLTEKRSNTIQMVIIVVLVFVLVFLIVTLIGSFMK